MCARHPSRHQPPALATISDPQDAVLCHFRHYQDAEPKHDRPAGRWWWGKANFDVPGRLDSSYQIRLGPDPPASVKFVTSRFGSLLMESSDRYPDLDYAEPSNMPPRRVLAARFSASRSGAVMCEGFGRAQRGCRGLC